MKTALERFDQWCAKHPDELQNIRERAQKGGLAPEEINRQISGMRWWLAQNEGTKKVNKRAWGRFVQNWLRRQLTTFGGRNSGRRNITEGKKQTGSYDL